MKAIFSGNRSANITSTPALVVALGGTGAYAANTIGSRDIRNGQVKHADLAPNAVTGAKEASRNKCAVWAPDPGMPDAALERSDTSGIASIEGGG